MKTLERLGQRRGAGGVRAAGWALQLCPRGSSPGGGGRGAGGQMRQGGCGS